MKSTLRKASSRAPLPAACLMFGAALLQAGCPADGTGIDAGVDVDGTGIVIIDGEEQQYALNLDDSSFVLLVPKAEATGCGVFHSHVIEALAVGMEFTIDMDDAAASSLKVTLPSSQLRADDADIRRAQPETEDEILSDSDRSAINNGMRSDQLEADKFSTLTFEVSNMSGTEGTDLTADVDATIKDTDSDFVMTYSSALDGDRLTVEGTGTLKGGEHGLPTGFGSNCLQQDWDVRLKLVLEPGVQTGVDAGLIDPYVQKEFPYEGECDDEAGYVDIAQFTMKNCAGCHKEEPILGATIPLLDYDDWRVDSVRHPDQPVYQTAGEFMRLGPEASTTMPPSGATAMEPDDKAAVLAWIDKGAPDVRCDPLIYEGFIPRNASPCGSPNYNDDIKPIMTNNCEYCHDGSSNPDEVPVLNTYIAGLEDADHPFYKPLTLWEASYYRIADKTMPPAIDLFPGTELTLEEATTLYQTWIESGYPEAACD